MTVKVFLNYRRKDDPGHAGRLYDRLKDVFPNHHVFMDVGGQLQLGDDFESVISKEVTKCDIMLVVIGPRWAELLRKHRKRAVDFVVIEIEMALRQRKRVVPVLVGDAQMPDGLQLPGSIRQLTRLQCAELRTPQFDADASHLVDKLQHLTSEVPRAPETDSGQFVDEVIRHRLRDNRQRARPLAREPLFPRTTTMNRERRGFAVKSLTNERPPAGSSSVRLRDPRYPYIPRDEVQQGVVQALEQVVASRESRAVVISGDGGVGKTYLLRELPDILDAQLATSTRAKLRWLGPFDLDDAEHWFVPNLEQSVVQALDPRGSYFEEYQEHVLRHRWDFLEQEISLAQTRQRVQLFADAFQRYVRATGEVPVLIFDTAEALRGLDVQARLVRFMKSLTSTMLVVASRPPLRSPGGLLRDFDKTPALPTKVLELRRFTADESQAYLEKSSISAQLSPTERAALAAISNGFPLWLVMGLTYFMVRNRLPELEVWHEPGVDRSELRASFMQRLLVPYRGFNFWAETVRRLGAVRRPVSRAIWGELMSDCALPEGMTSLDEAWKELLELPWIRVRSGREGVTLHDAVAEELAHHTIPAEDPEGSWRKTLWQRAASIYRHASERERSEEAEATATPESASLHAARWAWQICTAVYYDLLSDPQQGLERFLTLYKHGSKTSNSRLVQLLWVDLQRFIGEEPFFEPLDDVVKPQLEAFRRFFWQDSPIRDEVCFVVAQSLIDSGRADQALPMLQRQLQTLRVATENGYRCLRQLANAKARTPGQTTAAREDFQNALNATQSPDAEPAVRALRGDALMELAWCYRITGNWDLAAEYYRLAALETGRRDLDRRARIQRQYAYVLGLRGHYDEARYMVDVVLDIARKLQPDDMVVLTYATKALIHRYRGEFAQAMEAYEVGVALCYEIGRLDLLAQQRCGESITVFQAAENDVPLHRLSLRSSEALYVRARDLAEEAVLLCRDYNLRQLPVALNYAGRIVWGSEKVSNRRARPARQALRMFEEGYEVATSVADSWMAAANLVEQVALNFDIWRRRPDEEARSQLEALRPAVERQLATLDGTAFFALRGRVNGIEAYISLWDGVRSSDRKQRRRLIDDAITRYADSFLQTIRGYGPSRTPKGLRRISGPLQALIKTHLSVEEGQDWLDRLERAWNQSLHGEDHRLLSPALTTLLNEIEAAL